MLRLFIVCILLLLGNYADCQQTQKDSLLNELNRGSLNSKDKVDVLNELAFIDYDNDVEKAFAYASQALQIAKTSEYKSGTRRAQTLVGYYYQAKGDFNKALINYKTAANASSEPDIYLGYNYILTGNLYRSRSFFDSSQYYYNLGIGLLKKMNDRRFLPYGYRSLGNLQVQLWKNAQAEENFQNALKIYRSLRDDGGMAKVDFALGELYKNLAEFEKAEKFVNDGCALAESLGDPYLQTRCMIHKGEIKYKLGEFQEALHLLLDVIQRLKSGSDPETLVRVYSDLGDVYEAISQNDFAMRYTLEAIKIVENFGMKHEIGKLYCSVAWIYKNQQNYGFAFEFLDKSIKIREEIKDENGLGQCYNVMGIIYFQQKQFKEAIEWLEKSLTARSHVGNREGISACLYNLGLVYEAKKEYRQALEYQMKALEAEKKTGNVFNIGLGYSSVGSLFTYLKKYDSAKSYLQIADDIGIKTGSFELQMENALYWSEYYEHTGDTKTALEWHKKYSALNDTVYHATKATKLAEMQALYQTEQKDKEITLLNQEKTIQSNQLQLQEARINMQNYVILFAIVALVLVSLLTYKSLTYNKDIKQAHKEILEQKEELMAQSKELQEANRIIAENNKELEAKIGQRTFALREAYKELDTFFYRASHDFRRPLTTFLGLAEVAKITVSDPNARELFEKVRETAINLDKMLFKLQSISDLGSQQLVYGEVDVAEIFYRLLDQYKNELEARQIRTSSSFVLPQKFYSYPTMIFLILDNLIENSIMFCRYEGASLTLRAIETDSRIIIEIEDNGDGIEEKYQEHIFEMYFRGNDRSKGNGLGLYIVRKAVDKLNGAVSFRSARDKGTLFTITFPLSLESDSRGVIRSAVKDALVI
jgi:signal transduction histidine kinase